MSPRTSSPRAPMEATAPHRVCVDLENSADGLRAKEFGQGADAGYWDDLWASMLAGE